MEEGLKAFPLGSGTRQGCLTLPYLFNIVLEILARIIRKKEMICIKIVKEALKIPCLRTNDLVYAKI